MNIYVVFTSFTDSTFPDFSDEEGDGCGEGSYPDYGGSSSTDSFTGNGVGVSASEHLQRPQFVHQLSSESHTGWGFGAYGDEFGDGGVL